MTSHLIAILTACLLLAAASVAAQETAGQHASQADPPLISDRPDFTESAETVGRGRIQLEFGYTYISETDADEHSFPEILLRIGLIDRLELRIGLNSLTTKLDTGSETGGEDSTLAVKVDLNQEPRRGGPKLALIIGADLPTGSSGFGEDEIQPGGILAAGWELSERFSLGANLNYAYLSDGGDRYGEFGLSAAVGHSLGDGVGTFYEVYGLAPTDDNRPERYFFDTGATWLVSANIQLDAKLGVGLNSAASDFFAGVGTVFRW